MSRGSLCTHVGATDSLIGRCGTKTFGEHQGQAFDLESSFYLNPNKPVRWLIPTVVSRWGRSTVVPLYLGIGGIDLDGPWFRGSASHHQDARYLHFQ